MREEKISSMIQPHAKKIKVAHTHAWNRTKIKTKKNLQTVININEIKTAKFASS